MPARLRVSNIPHVVEKAVVGGVGTPGEVLDRLDVGRHHHLVEPVGHQRHRDMPYRDACGMSNDGGVHGRHHALQVTGGESGIARRDVLDDLHLEIDAFCHVLFLDDEPGSVDGDRNEGDGHILRCARGASGGQGDRQQQTGDKTGSTLQ